MAKLKSLAERAVEKTLTFAEKKNEATGIEDFYASYLKILECWEKKSDDSEFAQKLVSPANSERNDNLTSRTFVLRTMFDLMITTVAKNNAITATQLVDDILYNFFSSVATEEDLKPLSLKQFSSIMKKRLAQRGKTARHYNKDEQNSNPIKTLKFVDKKQKK